MNIHCRHCDIIFDMDKDDWLLYVAAHSESCEWFALRHKEEEE